MSVARPVAVSRAAWVALRDDLVEPARARGADQVALARLGAAWGSPTLDGDRATVWLTPEDATTLAGLLDAHPELAALLHG